MGLCPGTGVFLDQSRIQAPLSRGYCCPSYLLEIQDDELRKDILEAMDIFDMQSEPDYDHQSFNFGYAHRATSWEKFIDCVAIHEKQKHVVIVLNQEGAHDSFSVEDFQSQIFTPERLTFLKKKGYSNVILQEQGKSISCAAENQALQSGRRLTLILRRRFSPDDMKQVQLAAVRLLATGDNSAVESWCARCKLYLYENVNYANGFCKERFLRQQVDLAQTISPNLSRLLALFGGDGRLDNPCFHKPFGKEEMAQLEELLDDPDISDATFQLCDHITSNYSFDEFLEGALKRAAWHYLIPELSEVEAETLDEDFRKGIVNYLRAPKASTLTVRSLPKLRRRIEEAVQAKLLQVNT